MRHQAIHSSIIKFINSWICVLCVCIATSGKTQSIKNFDFVVAKDGTGQFTTLQAAINAVPDMRKTPTAIYIKNGVYEEKIVIPESKQMLTLVGESTEATIISWNDYASKKSLLGDEMGTSGSATMYIYSTNFTAHNLTIRNTAGPVGQAVALFVAGDKARFYNCRLLGHQDTLYTFSAQSRQYYFKCYIEGTTDFIFGASTAFFDSCTIYGKNGGQYFTAASTPEINPYGYVFRGCHFTGDTNTRYFLGRPWRPYAKTVLIDCQLDSLVRPEGWHNWNKPDAERTTFYAEYNNNGQGATRDKRVSWMHHLTVLQAKLYTPEVIFHDWAF